MTAHSATFLGFDNAKQVASFADLNPKNNTIGNWH
jgi:hypothetical protein